MVLFVGGESTSVVLGVSSSGELFLFSLALLPSVPKALSLLGVVVSCQDLPRCGCLFFQQWPHEDDCWRAKIDHGHVVGGEDEEGRSRRDERWCMNIIQRGKEKKDRRARDGSRTEDDMT